MKTLIYFFIIFFNLLIMPCVYSQQGVFSPGDYRDGIYDKENAVSKRVIPYSHLREADVTWEKRIWRRLDMRERQNQALYFPKEIVEGRISLPQLIISGILKGQILAFEDDEFLLPYDTAAIRKKLVIQGEPKEVEKYYEATDAKVISGEQTVGSSYMDTVPGAIDDKWFYETFSSLEIKEDWFLDKQKSSLEVRMLGLCFFAPIPGKEDLGEVRQFCVYYPSCRPLFAQNEVFNTKNDSERRTFEDIFWKRQFASNVVKESNVYDRKIDKYTKGIESILESEKIKMDIFRFEHDLWQF